MAIFLYCRISKKTQNIERQKRNLKAAFPDGTIVEEAYTGTTTARPQWSRLYKKATAGDTIAFDSVSRMSRDAEEGMAAYEDLYGRGVRLVFLKEPQINTDLYKEANSITLPRYGSEIDYTMEGLEKTLRALRRKIFLLAFEQAEKEVKDLQQRTREGLQTARLNGKHPGVKKGQKIETAKAKAAKKEILKLSRDFDGTNKDEEVRAIIGIARNTYYKYKAELKAARAAALEAEVAEVLSKE